eukprot:15470234-Alexandrium_andersonii.AAC.1
MPGGSCKLAPAPTQTMPGRSACSSRMASRVSPTVARYSPRPLLGTGRRAETAMCCNCPCAEVLRMASRWTTPAPSRGARERRPQEWPRMLSPLCRPSRRDRSPERSSL